MDHRRSSLANLCLALILVSFGCSERVDRPLQEFAAPPNVQSVDALLWFQTSAEAQALFYQAYNLARFRLVEALREPRSNPPAVVVDIDETLLDNSPHQARIIATGQAFRKERGSRRKGRGRREKIKACEEGLEFLAVLCFHRFVMLVALVASAVIGDTFGIKLDAGKRFREDACSAALHK